MIWSCEGYSDKANSMGNIECLSKLFVCFKLDTSFREIAYVMSFCEFFDKIYPSWI